MFKDRIEAKYERIRQSYGDEGVLFVRKIMGVYAQARGNDTLLHTGINRLYEAGEIIVFGDQDSISLRDKILLKHLTCDEKGYTENNAEFGFINAENVPVFAEQSSDLNNWDGTVDSVTTSILDIARSFHEEIITDPRKLKLANHPRLLVAALQAANGLSYHISQTQKLFVP